MSCGISSRSSNYVEANNSHDLRMVLQRLLALRVSRIRGFHLLGERFARVFHGRKILMRRCHGFLHSFHLILTRIQHPDLSNHFRKAPLRLLKYLVLLNRFCLDLPLQRVRLRFQACWLIQQFLKTHRRYGSASLHSHTKADNIRLIVVRVDGDLQQFRQRRQLRGSHSADDPNAQKEIPGKNNSEGPTGV